MDDAREAEGERSTKKGDKEVAEGSEEGVGTRINTKPKLGILKAIEGQPPVRTDWLQGIRRLYPFEDNPFRYDNLFEPLKEKRMKRFKYAVEEEDGMNIFSGRGTCVEVHRRIDEHRGTDGERHYVTTLTIVHEDYDGSAKEAPKDA